MQRIEQVFAVSYAYPVVFLRDAFGAGGDETAAIFAEAGPGPHRVLPVVDAGVLAADPGLLDRLNCWASRHRGLVEFVQAPIRVRGGEVCKTDPVAVGEVHAAIERHGLCRHSFVLAIGGGAVLDAVGYAAATAHRGVRLVRMPTTVLAQNDAGVGVKNGVNAFAKKNFVGTFAPPFAVVNDLSFLDTLSERDLRAGIAEAVKVALIRDRGFFDWLYAHRQALSRFEPSAMETMIIRCAELHLEHIRTSGDPFELGSSRPLDFGHWSAHRLEELSKGELRHGEAVAVGVALDAHYSRVVGCLDELSLRKILGMLDALGFDLCHWSLGWLDVGGALEAFREHLGGELTVTLLGGIGRGVEVHEIDTARMEASLKALASAPMRRQEAEIGHPYVPHEGFSGT